MKRFIAAIAVIVLCGLLCSCGYNPKEVGNVRAADGKEYVISCGRYLICQFTATDSALYTVDPSGATTLEKLLEGTVEGKPAREWIAAETERLLIRAAAVDRIAEENKVQFTPEEKYINEYSIGYGWNNFYSIYMANGISHETFYDYQMNMAMDIQLPNRLYSTGGPNEIPDSLVEEYLYDKIARMTFIVTPAKKVDGSALTEDEQELLDTYAENLRKDVEEQGFDAVIGTYEVLYEAVLGEGCFDEAYTQDQLVVRGDEQFPDAFYDMLLDSDMGEYGFYDAGSQSYVIFRRDDLKAEDTVAELKDEVAAVVAPDMFEKMLEKYVKGWTVELDQKAAKYYSVDKITFN